MPDLRPRRTPSQHRSAATVEAILEAAAQVFERHGYASGTTNRIAQRAGVSIGSLYQYFPNKDAILVTLVRRHVAEGTAVLAPLLAEFADEPPPLRAGLERLMSAMVELHARRPRLHRVLFEESPRPAALLAELEAVQAAGRIAVERWLAARPDVGVEDRALAAAMVVQVVESVTHGLVIHPEPGVAPQSYAAEAVDLLEAYLSRRPRSPRRATAASARGR